ncbi:MAG: hypothetical protein ACOX6K_00195 [Sphaerochaetaceae bacterium]|jgi:hypothetical protein
MDSIILSETQIETDRSFLVERLPSSPVLVASTKMPLETKNR